MSPSPVPDGLPAGPRWLLLRRGGTLWGVPSTAVRGVRRQDDGAAVSLERSSTSLQADELLEVAPTLRRYPLPACLAGMAMPAVQGLAVWNGAPVLLVDPAATVPTALLAPTGAETDSDAEGR